MVSRFFPDTYKDDRQFHEHRRTKPTLRKQRFQLFPQSLFEPLDSSVDLYLIVRENLILAY
jgi:hypothetical protein